jgi:hypothetical protein
MRELSRLAAEGATVIGRLANSKLHSGVSNGVKLED